MSAYNPKEVEPRWYEFWEKGGYFKPREGGTPFCVVIPPPNVTGVLHMGHALVNVLQDVIVRWRRMCGDSVLWVPGTDHGGISTQTVVERHLINTENKRRTDYDRDEFLNIMWRWKEESESTILSQLKRIGSSCDWSHYCFTMDEARSRAVRTFFHKLFTEGHIYRGDRLVHWDPVTQTALADDEVEHEEYPGTLYHIRYDDIVVATTRPETLFGDVAIAVAGDDTRYRHLIGKKVRLPLTDRTIPIIVDSRVDPTFGTGAVKVTPAHDWTDAEIGRDHHLPNINMMTPDGRLNEICGRFAGMTMEEGRQAVVQALREQGLLLTTTPHMRRVGRSYRSKAIVEPYLSKQWFINMAPFAPKMRQVVESGEVELIPENWKSTYFHWIDNLRDWCISRQLWWGHRIPVWYNKDNHEQMICWGEEGLPPEVAAHPDQWEQDPDVLDTWFSSSLWPLSVLGWPDKTPDLERFYPTSLLITGHDILFFWVARMIFAGTTVTGKVPFHRTWLHGLIFAKAYWRTRPDNSIQYVSNEERRKYDLGEPVPSDVHSRWEKMSKSSGNVIDPLAMIDEVGTDAMRMALCASATPSPQIDIDLRRFEEYRNFANKIWNGARFVFMSIEDANPSLDQPSLTDLRLEDQWILHRLQTTIQETNQYLSLCHVDKAAQTAYDFFWNDFCSIYLEIAKPSIRAGGPQKAIKQQLLAHILHNSLRLLHPMAPFITEELYQQLHTRFPHLPPACITAPYPQSTAFQPTLDLTQFDYHLKLITAVRQIRGEMGLPPKAKTDLIITGTTAFDPAILQALLPLSSIQPTLPPNLPFVGTAGVHPATLTIPLPTEFQERERARLIKEQDKIRAQLDRLTRQLSNPDFVSNAPPHLVDQNRAQLSQLETDLQTIASRLNS